MTTPVKYTGTTKPFFELAITGQQGSWMPGQIRDRSDADAALLIASGQGFVKALAQVDTNADATDGIALPDTVQALVSGAGIGKSAKPRILFLGDSIPGYGSAPQSIIMTTSTTPFGGSAFSVAYMSWANGSGSSGTLSFSKAAKTLRWAAPSEAAGAPVDVSRAGVYTIPGVTPTKTITVICRPRLYATATEGDFTVTTTTATEQSRRSGKGFPAWAHAKAMAGFDYAILSNGGSQIADINESLAWQVEAGAYDGIVIMAGTNDVSGDRTLAQMTDDMAALVATAQSKAKKVFPLTITPRSTSMTTGRGRIMSGFNQWVMSRANGLSPVNAFGRLVDIASATGAPLAGMLEDGLHPAIPGAEAIGEAVYQALDTAYAFERAPVVSSQADTYDATDNPLGNWLPAGGTFAGTGGTAGAGVSGVLAANWSVSREVGAEITVVCSQIARTDGMPGLMQRLVVSNAAGATSQRILIAPLSATRPAVTQGQVWRVKGAAVASSMAGVEKLSLAIEPAGMGGAFVASWGENQLAGATLSGSRDKLVMEPPPIEIPAGASFINIGVRAMLAAGGSITLDLLGGEWKLWRES